MKTLLISALALSSLTPSHADACGNYRPEPRVFRLSTHFIVGMGKANTRRTFALVPSRAPKGLAWHQLAPMSYDGTEIADGKPLANPMTLTLVGPSGTRVVKSTKHVYLSRSWDFDAPTGAIEIEAHGFSIALEGEQANAKWIELDDATSSQKLARWVTAQGVQIVDEKAIYVRRFGNTNIETVTLFPKGGTKFITLLKVGDRNHGNFTGSPIGAFTNNDVTQLVLVDGARVTPVYLGAGF